MDKNIIFLNRQNDFPGSEREGRGLISLQKSCQTKSFRQNRANEYCFTTCWSLLNFRWHFLWDWVCRFLTSLFIMLEQWFYWRQGRAYTWPLFGENFRKVSDDWWLKNPRNARGIDWCNFCCGLILIAIERCCDTEKQQVVLTKPCNWIFRIFLSFSETRNRSGSLSIFSFDADSMARLWEEQAKHYALSQLISSGLFTTRKNWNRSHILTFWK